MTIQNDVKELQSLANTFNRKVDYYKLFARVLYYLFVNQESIKRKIDCIDGKVEDCKFGR